MSLRTAPPRRPPARPGSRTPWRLVLLFAATAGIYWPLWLHSTYLAVHRGGRLTTRLTARTATLLALVPVVNLAGLAYIAVDLPRAVRRLRAGDSGGGPDTEVLSILLVLPVIAGIGLALALGMSV